MTFRRLAALAALSSFLATGHADAAIAFQITGKITQSEFDEAPFKSGDSFVLVYEIDPTAQDIDPTSQRAWYSNAVGDVSLAVGSYSLTSRGGYIVVNNDDFGYGADRYFVGIANGLPLNGANVESKFPSAIWLQLDDDTGRAFNSDAMPMNLPSASSFSSRTFTLQFAGDLDPFGASFVREARGTVDSISAVPLPPSVALMVMGLIGISLAVRRTGSGERQQT